MPVNLYDDWIQKFGHREPAKLQHPPAPIPTKPKVEKPVDKEESDDSSEEIDLVVDRKKSKSKPTPEVWTQNVESETKPVVTTKPRSNRIKEPVISGRKVYISSATANWGLVRAGAYPAYKEYCLKNNIVPDIREFNSILAPQWKMLSPEDKCKAAQNPTDYFVFE
jgi:hypothetical protein